MFLRSHRRPYVRFLAVFFCLQTHMLLSRVNKLQKTSFAHAFTREFDATCLTI